MLSSSISQTDIGITQKNILRSGSYCLKPRQVIQNHENELDNSFYYRAEPVQQVRGISRKTPATQHYLFILIEYKPNKVRFLESREQEKDCLPMLTVGGIGFMNLLYLNQGRVLLPEQLFQIIPPRACNVYMLFLPTFSFQKANKTTVVEYFLEGGRITS